MNFSVPETRLEGSNALVNDPKHPTVLPITLSFLNPLNPLRFLHVLLTVLSAQFWDGFGDFGQGFPSH